MPLTIVAKIVATPGKEAFVQSALEKLIAPTLAEAGCIQYDLHRDNDAPGTFLFYETWETRALWQAHMQSQHLADHAAATEGTVVEVTLHEMTKIG
ncbi:Quinol monooxygenase YgiN [Jannaschia faecimaris]|uniref:Quinol monooxygenase YgiN n=1 Tax=Jannaschia faecimaris TaxID=1244108 RepID=A0A1H3UDQ9_9RHOB|nr:putative quinol monooxygenase [Jannaschia faecimaris]SDZ60427.1 Quinol monooxygenase YgiN [Jannaschia faecimaris]